MDLLNVALVSLGSILFLFLLTKLIGNKQMSQLNLFDYINGITIGSIAAEMATALESDFLKPLLAMCIYAFATIGIDHCSKKSRKSRRIFEGKSTVLMDHGKLYYSNFKKAKLDISEFLAQCRTSGYFSLSDLHTVVLEANGQLSFLPISDKRPATPMDLSLAPKQEQPELALVEDGVVIDANLRRSGKDAQWLTHALKAQGCKLSEVFVALCDDQNQLSVYKKETGGPQSDRFQ